MGIPYTQTELWLTPYTRVIDEECNPIREAIASVAGDDKEDAGEKQDRQE